MQDALFRDPFYSSAASRRSVHETDHQPSPIYPRYIPPMVIVIDGLDECCYQAQVNELIPLLVLALSQFPFRLLFTSLPEANIQAIFSRRGISDDACFITLRDFNAYRDVYEYLWSHLSNVRIARGLPTSWPSNADLHQLARQLEGIFIYASTLVIDDKYGNSGG